MAGKVPMGLPQAASWTCMRCQIRPHSSRTKNPFSISLPIRTLSTSSSRREQLRVQASVDQTDLKVTAAPPIDLTQPVLGDPARVVPASASYFTTSPGVNDYLLRLTHLINSYGTLPMVSGENAPRIAFMELLQFRSAVNENVGAAKYSRLLNMLRRLNRINPALRPKGVQMILEEFRRPGSEDIIPPKPKYIDAFGRSRGVGRRKSAVARVQLIEGDGEVLVNGRTLFDAFPRMHDRESVVWPLKITNRLDKYNAFVIAEGGGVTGQAESATLAMANALIVHEPALKPILRKGTFVKKVRPSLLTGPAGCITRVIKRVERKKHGRVKARKRPAWVKR
jgi:small subunit ribosomal protein S9